MPKLIDYKNKPKNKYFVEDKRIPKALISEARERVSIVDFLSNYVDLIQCGEYKFKGLCPFHDDKSPSFYVSDDKGFYYCFGCQASGDIITFLMDFENLSFPEAANRLLREAGLQKHLSEDSIKQEAALINKSISANIDKKQNRNSNVFYTGTIESDLLYIAQTCYNAVKNNKKLFNKIEKLYKEVDDSYRFKNYERIKNICKNIEKELQ